MGFTHNNSKGTTYHLNKKDVTLKSTGRDKQFITSQKIQDQLLATSQMDTLLRRTKELDYLSYQKVKKK